MDWKQIDLITRRLIVAVFSAVLLAGTFYFALVTGMLAVLFAISAKVGPVRGVGITSGMAAVCAGLAGRRWAVDLLKEFLLPPSKKQ